MNEEIRDRAFRDYQNGMKYKEIAEKYGVSLSAVKSWAARYWKSGCDQKEKGCNRKEKKLQPEKKKVAVIPENTEVAAEEVRQVIDNPDLTDKQRLFCLYYIRCFNATKAYQKAYKVDYSTAASIGYRLLENVGVREEIARLKQNRLNREMLDEHDIFQKYMDIAFADITDYVEFRQEKVQVMAMYGPVYEKNEDGEKIPVTKIVNAVRFKDSREVDGTIISEVKQGKDGASIKLADRMKALQWLTDHMDMATEEQRARIAQVKAQTDYLNRDKGADGELDGVEVINDVAEKADAHIGDNNTKIL